MNPSLAPVTFQQIYIFLATVEEHGFAKAGIRLHLTQSTISKNISRLEQTLGIPLFHRTTREIRLTPAGEELYAAWAPLLQDFEEAFRHAEALQIRATSSLDLGVVNTVTPEVYMNTAMTSFQKRFPDKSMSFGTGHIWELEQKLENSGFDAIMLPDFERFWAEPKGYSYRYIARSCATVLLSEDHPLAGRGSLTTKDILNCDFTVFSYKHGNNCARDLEERFAPFGRKPRIVHKYESAHDMKYQFRKDHTALVFLDSFFDYPQLPGIRRISVTDQENGIICVWDPRKQKQLLRQFIRYCLPET